MQISKSNLVRKTCQRVVDQAQHVKINHEKLNKMAKLLQDKKYLEFDQYDCHFSKNNNPEQILQYLFALDTLNFCFWTQPGFEYFKLAANIKKLLEEDPNGLSPSQILNYTRNDIKHKIFEGHEFSLLDERYRLLQETALITIKHFGGCYTELINKSNRSSQELLWILTSYFTGFQDHAIYNGEQIFYYKRAQILIGDIYAAFKGQGIGQFDDIDQLTMFPDYRVPQLLKDQQVIEYSEYLTNKIQNFEIIEHASKEEQEIRAASVIVVEELKKILNLKSIEVDWLLWQLGEDVKDNIFPHHRTLSIFY